MASFIQPSEGFCCICEERQCHGYDLWIALADLYQLPYSSSVQVHLDSRYHSSEISVCVLTCMCLDDAMLKALSVICLLRTWTSAACAFEQLPHRATIQPLDKNTENSAMGITAGVQTPLLSLHPLLLSGHTPPMPFHSLQRGSPTPL